jgi:hypothetical protein
MHDLEIVEHLHDARARQRSQSIDSAARRRNSPSSTRTAVFTQPTGSFWISTSSKSGGGGVRV